MDALLQAEREEVCVFKPEHLKVATKLVLIIEQERITFLQAGPLLIAIWHTAFLFHCVVSR